MRKEQYDPKAFAAGLPVDGWTKSSFSGAAPEDCVQWQQLSDGGLALGDSKFPQLGALRFTATEKDAFIAAVKAGELD